MFQAHVSIFSAEFRVFFFLQQRIISKRKLDQGMNNIHLSCDNENGQIGGESLTKYSRADDVHNSSLVSHEQISLPSSQADQQQQSASQADSLSSENMPSGSVMGSNGHFVGDTSRSSPLLSSSGAHSSETYQNANRVSSPNSLPPTEFKQESHSIAVSCDGGRTVRTGSRDSLPNGLASGRASTENRSTDPGVGQDLQTQLNDFERVLMSYTNSDMFKNAGIPSMNSEISPQHHQISRQAQQSQIDARETLNVQQQNPSVPNQATGQKNPYPTPPSQGPPGALHLQHLARQAQSQRAQAVSGYMDGQEQDASQQFRSQQMQFIDSIRFAVSGSQPQMPNQNANQPAQFSAAGRFRGSMATGPDQFGNMYSSKDQNHNVIMSTGFASNTTQSLQYQRMMQSQAQQQALYSRLNQQQSMSQRLSHPSIPEHQQTSYQQYPVQVSMSQTVPQGGNNMSMQNLPPYTNSGYQNIQSSQAAFQRQMSMPLPGQAYPDQYTQQISQYPVGDQQVPSQPQPQQTDMSSTAYHYNRRNSFPLYHRSMSQPVATYGLPGTAYQGQVNQMRNNMPPGQNPANAMIDSRTNTAAGYNYNNRTTGFPSQSGLQGLMQMPQRNRASMAHSGAMPPSRPDQQTMAYSANIRDSNAQNISQEMKYSTRNEVPKVTRAQSFSDPLALGDPTATANSDSNYNPFSPLGSLEKAPSFASLLEQSSGSLNNLETTYTGSIPNLDLLGEIIG